MNVSRFSLSAFCRKLNGLEEIAADTCSMIRLACSGSRLLRSSAVA